MKQRYGFGRFSIPVRVMLPAVVALALLTAAALAGIFTAQAQTAAPQVANVEIASTPASGTSYSTGETIYVRVTFDQDVVLRYADDSQRPQLKLSIGAIQSRTAPNVDVALAPGDGGDNVLMFGYVVAANDHENYGISIIPKFTSNGLASPLSVPDGGSITGASGADANLWVGEHSITLAYGHRVNAATPEPPANVQAVQHRAGIRVTWDQPGSIRPDYYVVERRFHGDPPSGESAGPVWERINGHFRTYYDNFRLYNGASYSYRVQGYQNNRHNSRISAAATVDFTWTQICDPEDPRPPKVKNSCVVPAYPTPPPDVAPAPTPAPTDAPRISDATHNSVIIDWSRLIGAGGAFQVSPTANGFHISRRAAADVEFDLIVNLPLGRTSFQDVDLDPGTTYTWRLYEDHPNHRYNLMGEVTHTTLPAP